MHTHTYKHYTHTQIIHTLCTHTLHTHTHTHVHTHTNTYTSFVSVLCIHLCIHTAGNVDCLFAIIYYSFIISTVFVKLPGHIKCLRLSQQSCCLANSKYLPSLVDPSSNTVTKCLWTLIKNTQVYKSSCTTYRSWYSRCKLKLIYWLITFHY